uniref:Cdc37 N-terminal domain-containing protein n=1 Tax=Romanomermis culicivorax TaxID=13658 RepID=A0A915KQD2_ROMCU
MVDYGKKLWSPSAVKQFNMPVDYHKWDHIEVSDDEDDTHPNVDTASLFRWRHQARLERMEEAQREKDKFKESVTSHQQKMSEIKQKLASVAIAETDKERLKLELSELEKQEEEFKRKEDELAKKERLQPLNIDTIGREGFSKSRINKIEPAPPNPVDDETKAEEMITELLPASVRRTPVKKPVGVGLL